MIHLIKQIAIGTAISLALYGCQKDALNTTQIDSINNSLSGTSNKASAALNAPMTAQSIQVNVKGVRKNYQITGTDPFLINHGPITGLKGLQHSLPLMNTSR